MEPSRFDTVTRELAATDWPRRRLWWLLAGALGGVLGPLAPAGRAKKKKRKKKKKKRPSCVSTCAGKSCGDSDGCGGTCSACPQGQTCQNTQCVSDDCEPSCHGGHVCQNGSCVCPAGLQTCDQYWCGECCSNAECPGFPDPLGQTCIADGDRAMFCGCLSGVDCGDGRCVQCCNSDYCLLTYGPGMFCNVHGFCVCPEETTYCGEGMGCVDTGTNHDACGPNCTKCGAGQNCEAGRCCVGLANECVFSDDCCPGLGCVNIGTYDDPHYVCGVAG